MMSTLFFKTSLRVVGPPAYQVPAAAPPRLDAGTTTSDDAVAIYPFGDPMTILRSASILTLAAAVYAAATVRAQPQPSTPGVSKAAFGTLSGQPVDIFTLRNANGIEVKATNYGAIITSIVTPDKAGKRGDITLGFDTFDEYLKNT